MINKIKQKGSRFLEDLTAASTPVAKARLFCALNLALNRDAQRIKRMKNLHQNRRAFVIGNGPSLRMADLEKLSGEVTFASNKIYLAFEQVKWRPTYHFIEDDKVLQRSLKEIAGFSHQAFLGRDALNFGERIPKAIYYWRDFHVNPHNPSFQKTPLGHFHMGYSVLYSCLQLAFYMGISEVYLLGVDSDYAIPSVTVNKGAVETPVYECEGEVNHFHPDYYTPGDAWYDPNLLYQRIGFQHAKEIYEKDGRMIRNATRGGKLDVFPRVDLDSLF